jgi:hypothetical protein
MTWCHPRATAFPQTRIFGQRGKVTASFIAGTSVASAQALEASPGIALERSAPQIKVCSAAETLAYPGRE